MKYPVIALDELERVAAELLRDPDANIETSIKWIGDGEEVDLAELTVVAREAADVVDQSEKSPPIVGDDAEGPLSGRLHAALRGLPVRTLDDPGFWRYVSTAQLWRFVLARQRSTFETGEWTKYRKYIDGRARAECVPLRMFVRGQVARRGEDYSLASGLTNATDLWRSHVIRIRTSYSPTLAQGFIEQQNDARMPLAEVRAHAKRITRMASNVVLHLYEKDDVDALLTELAPEQAQP